MVDVVIIGGRVTMRHHGRLRSIGYHNKFKIFNSDIVLKVLVEY